MELEVKIAGQDRLVSVQRAKDGGWTVAIDGGTPFHVAGGRLGKGEWTLAWQGQRRVAGVHVDGDRVDVQLGDRDWRASVVDARKAALQLGAGGAIGLLSTQMPGIIVRVLVAEGDPVVEGQPVIVVEAMKMENEFKAPVSGTVTTVHVQPGQAVESGSALVLITPDA